MQGLVKSAAWILWIGCSGLALAAVEFPGTPPNQAGAVAGGNLWTLSNNVLSASWLVESGKLRPFCFVNNFSGTSLIQTNCELFRLSYASQTTNSAVRLLRIQVASNHVQASVSLDGVSWTILGSYPREEFPGDPSHVQLGKLDDRGGNTDYPGNVGGVGQCRMDDLVIQDAAGTVLLADDFNVLSPDWTTLLSTQSQTSVTATNGSLLITAHHHTFASVQRPVPNGAAVFTCLLDKYTDWGYSWGPGLCVRWAGGRFLAVKYCQAGDDVYLVVSSFHADSNEPASFYRCLPLRYELAASDFEIVSGPQIFRSDPAGYELDARLRHAGTGTTVDWRAVLRDGANYLRQFITISASNSATTLKAVQGLDCHADDPFQGGGVQGSPVVGHQWFGALEAPWCVNTICSNRVQSGFACALPFSITNQYQFSSVTGVFPAGQMRRAFLYYLERERAAPYRPLLHYNSWFDVYGNVTESNFLAAIERCDQQLRQRRAVACDSFAIDEGWDNTAAGFWQMDTNKFPNAFQTARDRAALAGAALGVWISPLGGYDPSRTERTQRAREAGIIPSGVSLDLSIRSYYDWFLNKCREFIRDDGVNYLKWDKASGGPDPHTMALARLATELHRDTTNLFLNMTVGSWSSPFWLLHVDSTWRGALDGSLEGVGTDREKAITYRDAQTCRAVGKMSPLYPLNSIMTCGIICNDASDGEDLLHDARAFFGSGTAVQELYLRPSVLSSNVWNYIADAARWARQNPDVLVDTHWIGGNPARLEIYGWASWTPRKGILVLRNPSDTTNSIAIDAATVFELPADAARTCTLSTPYPDQRLPVTTLTAGVPVLLTMMPFEVLVFDASPRITYADWLEQNRSTGGSNTNLLAYAFHLDPCAPPPASPVQFQLISDTVVIQFPWNLAASDIDYTIETSTDLHSWSPAAVSENAVYIGNGTLQITATAPLSDEPRRFYRLRVTRTP